MYLNCIKLSIKRFNFYKSEMIMDWKYQHFYTISWMSGLHFSVIRFVLFTYYCDLREFSVTYNQSYFWIVVITSEGCIFIPGLFSDFLLLSRLFGWYSNKLEIVR